MLQTLDVPAPRARTRTPAESDYRESLDEVINVLNNAVSHAADGAADADRDGDARERGRCLAAVLRLAKLGRAAEEVKAAWHEPVGGDDANLVGVGELVGH